MALILVVDDEPMLRLVATDYLEAAGHSAIEAASADEAIKILETRTGIEVVFSDVQMPGSIDGLRLINLIRDRWPPIRLILTSGKALPNVNELPKGAKFVPKPYDGKILTQALDGG